MADGVDQIGPMDEKSMPCHTKTRVAISKDRVLILLIALAVSMTGLAPDQAVALLRLIGL